MKTVYRIIASLAMLVAPVMAIASMPRTVVLGDTVPTNLDTIDAATRYPNYYYTKWFDECTNFYPDGGVVDSCFCRFPTFWNFYPDNSVAKWEHTKNRMKVKGLVAMVDRYVPPTNDTASAPAKRPEYLYLYQLVGRHYAMLEQLGIEDGLDLVIVDSVRWDTARAKVMELKRGWNGEYNQYCYLYEAYFKSPVYVDSDFYIFGSTNSNVRLGHGSSLWQYVPTEYVDIMDYSDYVLNNNDSGCTLNNFYQDIIHDECIPQGGYVGINDGPLSTLGWYSPWPDSPWGYYLAIVDQWDLEAVPDSAEHGEVIGGGRWPDESYDTIEAIPAPGYHFYMWSDGVTENPRVIYLTSDTSFTAIFYSNELYSLQVSSSDPAEGTVTGGGTFHGDTDNTIAAVPNYGYKFHQWNDGVTDNPRVVHLVSDTAFTAYFVELPRYTVQAAVNNDEWGSVEGGGVYMEGEQATLTVTTAPFCIFDGWEDGDWSLPRIVTVTQDTLFTAILRYDSVWAAGIDKAGALEFTVSPNPTGGLLTVRTSRPGDFALTVYDMNGKALINTRGEDAVFDVDLGSLPTGKYLLILRSKDAYGVKTILKK